MTPIDLWVVHRRASLRLGRAGEGCDVADSDRFYHWGALLGLMTLMEAGPAGQLAQH